MGKPLTPQQEIDQLRALIREAHEVLKDLTGALREAKLHTKVLIDGFQQVADTEVKQLGNWLRTEHNRISAEMNANVAAARVEVMRQMTASELAYNEETGRWALYFQAGKFSDDLPLPHPDQPVKDITP